MRQRLERSGRKKGSKEAKTNEIKKERAAAPELGRRSCFVGAKGKGEKRRLLASIVRAHPFRLRRAKGGACCRRNPRKSEEELKNRPEGRPLQMRRRTENPRWRPTLRVRSLPSSGQASQEASATRGTRIGGKTQVGGRDQRRWRERRRQKMRRRMPMRMRERLSPTQRPRAPQWRRKQRKVPRGRPMSQ